jgi:hypothetical protein
MGPKVQPIWYFLNIVKLRQMQCGARDLQDGLTLILGTRSCQCPRMCKIMQKRPDTSRCQSLQDEPDE